jgi:hypothetical protein
MQSEEEPSVWTPASYGGLVQACPAPTSTTTPSVTTAYPGHLDECCFHPGWMKLPHLADANATCTQPLAVTPRCLPPVQRVSILGPARCHPLYLPELHFISFFLFYFVYIII